MIKDLPKELIKRRKEAKKEGRILYEEPLVKDVVGERLEKRGGYTKAIVDTMYLIGKEIRNRKDMTSTITKSSVGTIVSLAIRQLLKDRLG